MRWSRANRRKVVRARRALPKVPRIRIDWRALVVPPLALGLIAAAVVGTRFALDVPVRTLTLEGTFQRVTPIQIEAAIAPELTRGFLSLDLDAVRARVEALDWVDRVTVARAWPGRLVVRVTEHQAAARWGETGLLNVRGEVFTNSAQHRLPELPTLAGPPGSEREVAELYLALRGRLAAANLTLEELSLDERGAWRLVLAGGQEIRLGRREVDERLERFFGVVTAALAGEFERVRYVDLRYTNGFAVGWVGDDAPERSTAGAPVRLPVDAGVDAAALDSTAAASPGPGPLPPSNADTVVAAVRPPLQRNRDRHDG